MADPTQTVIENPVEQHGEQSFLLVKPLITRLGADNEIRMVLERNRFWVLSAERLVLTPDAAREFLLVMSGVANEAEVNSLSGPCVLFIVAKDAAVADLRKLCGDDDPSVARIGTLHYMFGTDRHNNGVYVPASHKKFADGFGVLRAWRDLYYAAIKNGGDDAMDRADYFVKRIAGQNVDGEVADSEEVVSAPLSSEGATEDEV